MGRVNKLRANNDGKSNKKKNKRTKSAMPSGRQKEPKSNKKNNKNKKDKMSNKLGVKDKNDRRRKSASPSTLKGTLKPFNSVKVKDNKMKVNGGKNKKKNKRTKSA